MNNKYISFDWWWGGWNNIRMTYELIGSISYVTGRTIILPPKGYCLFLSEHSDKESFFDVWDILDKEKYTSQYNCIEYKDSPLTKYESDTQYFDGICKDVQCILFEDLDINWGPQQFPNKGLIYQSIEDVNHFNEFNCDDRKLYNVYSEDSIIHFPRNLLGHFGYHIYPPNDIAANVMRDKVKNGVVYRKEFKTLADELILSFSDGDFDALHIRRNDFKYVHTDLVNKQYENLLEMIDGRVRKDKPLFIATDEKDLSLFNDLKKQYNVTFLNDLKETHKLDLVIDGLICSESTTFLGSRMSTFSDNINILRGYKGKKDFSREGINYKKESITYKKYPWESEPYAWHDLWGELYYGKV
jgi:hypothetical protein